MGRRHQDSRAKQEVIAIVDIGSTAVRFLLARVTPGASYRVLVEERVPTRLGGGASLQLSRVRDRRVVSMASLPLGAVRTTSTFLRANRPRSRELQAFRQEVRERLTGALPAAGRGEVMVGMGGTVRSLASIHMRAHRGERKHRHGLTLQQSDVTAIRERLEALSLRKRRKIRGLNAERADIILAGAIVLEETMVFGGYLRLIVCTRGVRDGLLLRETFNGRG